MNLVRPRPPWPIVLLTGAPLVALDQVTKWWVVARIGPRGYRDIIPDWFSLIYATNRGAAWGMFQGASMFFLVLAIAALVALAVLWRQGAFAGAWMSTGFCLLVPGILGNLSDRITRGYVVDFLSFDLHFPGAHPFATFNVADSCISVAVACFLIGSFRWSGDAVKPADGTGDARP